VRSRSLWLLLCVLHGISGSTLAQSTDMPEWIVPVLRLVSSTHAEPTTGVVLSADGLVLVPADFASPGDEIVVLDGGNDIIRNGRPARLERAFPEFGFELLMVEGLHHSPAPIAPTASTEGSSLRLRAFPPAEQIAEGALPIDARTTVTRLAENETPAPAGDAPLPNVTGALLDECGNLAGISMADGVQSLDPSPNTQYRWGASLQAVLTELQLPLSGLPCGGAAMPTPDETPAEPVTETGPAIDETAMPEPAESEAAAGEELTESEGVEPAPEIKTLPPYEGDLDDDVSEAEQTVAEPESPSWLWLLAALLMLAGGGAIYLLRRASGKEGPDQVPGAPEASAPLPAGEAAAGPPDLRLDSRLVLRGVFADGREFEVEAAVSERAINVEIGRGNADLVIDSASVSRRHACLNGTRDALTLTDLGSSNGSSINGVPCLEGEIMYLGPGDQVVLGDTCFTVSIEALSARNGDS